VQFEITLLFLVGILLCLISMMVLVIYIVDRVRVVATGLQTRADVPPTTDANFHELDGQPLWDALTAGEVLQDAELATRLVQVRRAYADVLRRHIEEVFEEGLLDGRQGVRLSPPPLRSIKTSGGYVNSWLPLEESNEIYSIGTSKGAAVSGELDGLRIRLEHIVLQLFERTGCGVPEGFAASLIPVASPLLMPSPATVGLSTGGIVTAAAVEAAMPALEPTNT
jgi:hypothetical protein